MGHGSQCICKVCQCGKHHCPPATHTAEGKFQGVSEYNTNYHNQPLERVQNFKPVHVPLQTGAFSAVTENREQFVPRLADRQVPVNPQVPSKVYVPSTAKFSSETTTATDFVPHTIEARKAKAKAQWQPTEGAVSSVTTNRQDYKAWEMPPQYRHEKAVYVPSAAKLEGESVLKSDYKAWPTQRIKQHEPEKYHATTEDRAFDTTSSSAYHGFGDVERAKSFKPLQPPPPPTKFDAHTTNESDFKVWPVQRPQLHEQAKYQPNANAFEGRSEYNTCYIPKPVQPHTTPVGAQATYVPSKAVFDAEPLYKTDFAAKPIPPRYVHVKEVFVPAAEERKFQTDYTTSYVPKPIVPCPAVIRKNELTEKGNDGHMYFVESAVRA